MQKTQTHEKKIHRISITKLWDEKFVMKITFKNLIPMVHKEMIVRKIQKECILNFFNNCNILFILTLQFKFSKKWKMNILYNYVSKHFSQKLIILAKDAKL